MSEYVLYVKRTKGALYGVATLKDPNGDDIVTRLPIASGQLGYLSGGQNDWVKGKSPTPIGDWFLSTKRVPLQMEPVGTAFYSIGDSPGSTTITSPDGRVVREDIGLHLENRYPGTIGCVALLHDTPERVVGSSRLFRALDDIYKKGITSIRVRVFF
jgi:hypothetical protein